MSRIIGGEFEINPVSLKNQSKRDIMEGLYYSSGRAALYYILENITLSLPKINTVLLPNYLCETIIETVRLKNFKIKYYELTDQLTIEKEKFSKQYSGKEVVFVINYFGLTNTDTQIDFIRRLDSNSCVILDNVQAYYEMCNQSKANYSFTSFRKWFPSPDGALVKTTEKGMFLPKTENRFSEYKIAGAILKEFRTSNVTFDHIYISLFDKGERLILNDLTSKISTVSKNIFCNLDFDFIASRRRENAKFVINELLNLGIKPIFDLTKESVPLFIPIQVSRRDLIRFSLAKKGIFCPIHWPAKVMDILSKDKEMAENELSIVIDQRYNKRDMIQIITTIKKCLSE